VPVCLGLWGFVCFSVCVCVCTHVYLCLYVLMSVSQDLSVSTWMSLHLAFVSLHLSLLAVSLYHLVNVSPSVWAWLCYETVFTHLNRCLHTWQLGFLCPRIRVWTVWVRTCVCICVFVYVCVIFKALLQHTSRCLPQLMENCQMVLSDKWEKPSLYQATLAFLLLIENWCYLLQPISLHLNVQMQIFPRHWRKACINPKWSFV